ncbi:hypothetical protein [Caloranaerobacter sp. TR13]|uniref:phosphorylase family protein n=1 Tax=Caloranaerobacter sp. TR13 TaxID=1302151 RepID=UPI0006D3DEC0|nr:hypothetical protein [Caloranaerobacter sp. TR13]
MKLGIIGSSENEIMPFVKCISDAKTVSTAMLKFYDGVYKNINVVALYCGVCKVNAAIATQVLIDKFDVFQELDYKYPLIADKKATKWLENNLILNLN